MAAHDVDASFDTPAFGALLRMTKGAGRQGTSSW
jgi:hypothetical protein